MCLLGTLLHCLPNEHPSTFSLGRFRAAPYSPFLKLNQVGSKHYPTAGDAINDFRNSRGPSVHDLIVQNDRFAVHRSDRGPMLLANREALKSAREVADTGDVASCHGS